MYKLLTLLPLSIALAATPVLPTIAQVQHISEDAAVNATSKIKLQVGRGINLKLPAGTRVYKGWVSDRSLVQVDGDRPFEDGASIVHLLANKAGKTNLSMIVSDGESELLYVFELIAQSKSVAPIVSVTGSSSISPSLPNPPSPNSLVNASYTPAQSVQASGVDIFRSGVENAISQGLLAPNGELHQAINKFISHYQSGKSLDAATRKAKLQPAVVEQLFELGRRSAPAPKPTTAPAPDLVVEASQQPEVEVPPKPKKVMTAKVKKSKPDASYQAIMKRLEKLENKVDGIEDEVESLDKQQGDFVAKLEQFNQQQDQVVARLKTLDDKQDEFLAKLNGSEPIAHSPKQRPITLTLQVPELPSPKLPEADVPLAVGGPVVDDSMVTTEDPDYSPYQIAAALRYGLTTAHHRGEIRNGTSMYFRVNSLIRRVNLDKKSVPSAAKLAGVPAETAKQVLLYGKIDPEHVGF